MSKMLQSIKMAGGGGRGEAGEGSRRRGVGGVRFPRCVSVAVLKSNFYTDISVRVEKNEKVEKFQVCGLKFCEFESCVAQKRTRQMLGNELHHRTRRLPLRGPL